MGTWLTAIGLALGFIGALLMFRFGVPAYPDKSSAGNIHIIAEQSDEDEKQRVERAEVIAKVGVALLAFGFLLQFVGLVI